MCKYMQVATLNCINKSNVSICSGVCVWSGGDTKQS